MAQRHSARVPDHRPEEDGPWGTEEAIMDRTTSDAGLRAQHHRLLARLHAVHEQRRVAARRRVDPDTGSPVDAIADPLEDEALRQMEAVLSSRLVEVEMELEHHSGSLLRR
jgi:hypothetical protein